MDDVPIEVVGDRVRQARHLRRLDSREVAFFMGWSPPTQTKLEQEASKMLPRTAASRLAAVLRVPIPFLTAAPAPSMSISDLRFRAPKKTTQQEKNYLVQFARWVGEFAFRIDEIHNLPPVRLPRPDPCATTSEIARTTRCILGVDSSQPIGHLTHMVERLGIIVVVRVPGTFDVEMWDKAGDVSIEKPDKGERHFGYSTWIGPYKDRPLSILRAIDSWERTRWTVAHELGHLLLHRNDLPDDAEVTASRFASELLAPVESIRHELGRHVTLADLIPVKLKWGISIGALIRHLRDSETISRERADALSRQLYTRINPSTGRTWGIDEPGWDDRSAERPRLLSRWAERCFGTSSAPALASMIEEWPSDLLNSMLTAQRGPHSKTPRRNIPIKKQSSNKNTVVPLFPSMPPEENDDRHGKRRHGDSCTRK